MRILIGIFLLYAAACAFGQALPVKEGLWENTVLDDDGSVAMRSLNCVTQKSFSEIMAKANTQPGCTVNSRNVTNHGMTVDVVCTRPHVQTSAHSVVELLDPEHERAITTMKMTVNGKSNESSTKSNAHFVKSDCGNIKPGGPQVTVQ
jgi:hypothetical protein